MDRNIKNTWMRAQYDRTVTRAYETTAKEENGCVEIETSYSISSPALQRILAGVIKWTIYSDGTTDVHVEAKKDPVFPVLPRFGLRLFLPESFAELTYCGLGRWRATWISTRQAITAFSTAHRQNSRKTISARRRTAATTTAIMQVLPVIVRY